MLLSMGSGWEQIKEKANEKSICVYGISVETEEGIQFYKAFGGAGAILRY